MNPVGRNQSGKKHLYEKALFIFRRDLRLSDNKGLLFALENAKEVIPCFIFTPAQIEHNSYRSDRSLQFMIESLEDLEEQLQEKGSHLSLLYGNPEEIVLDCIQKSKIDAVIVNRDYTPFSIKRDQKIEAVCKKKEIAFHSLDDALLHLPEETLKADGKPYSVFTPFYRNASHLEVPLPVSNHFDHYHRTPLPFAEGKSLYKKILPKRLPQAKGGRKEALQILKQNFSNYKSIRDFPAEDGTTHLSPHLKFTTCSAREVFHHLRKHLGRSSDLIRSLYWRDFFTLIAFYFPKVFQGCFHSQFDEMQWSYDKRIFNRWCEGKTGFPIVDAGMRELNQTGFMQNRARMITASFLVKDLHIDWRWGEKYFAQNLIDYDPAVNNGNWQWCASTGCDAQPYFRIFNPWIQQKKFDPECLYIKKWIPELASLSPKEIHTWFQKKEFSDYPAPLVDHSKESKKALASYKKLATST